METVMRASAAPGRATEKVPRPASLGNGNHAVAAKAGNRKLARRSSRSHSTGVTQRATTAEQRCRGRTIRIEAWGQSLKGPTSVERDESVKKVHE